MFKLQSSTKKDLRRQIIAVRNRMPNELREYKDKIIFKNFTELLIKEEVKTVLLYASLGSEVNTWNIFQFCIENSIKTAFPKVSGGNLELYWIENKEQLSPGFKSILEPKYGSKASLEQIEIIAVPGVAFDKECYRIGYGGGFYDRLLSKRKGLAVGLAYEEQLIEEIPKETFDEKIDLIITDKRVISCV